MYNDLFSQPEEVSRRFCATCAYICEELNHHGVYYCDLSKKGISPDKLAPSCYTSSAPKRRG